MHLVRPTTATSKSRGVVADELHCLHGIGCKSPVVYKEENVFEYCNGLKGYNEAKNTTSLLSP